MRTTLTGPRRSEKVRLPLAFRTITVARGRDEDSQLGRSGSAEKFYPIRARVEPLLIVKHGLIPGTKRDAVDDPFRHPDPPVVRVAASGGSCGCFTLDCLLLPDRVEHFSSSLVLPSRSFLFCLVQLFRFPELRLQRLAGWIRPGGASSAEERYQTNKGPPSSHPCLLLNKRLC
jgi:hypothetical protein